MEMPLLCVQMMRTNDVTLFSSITKPSAGLREWHAGETWPSVLPLISPQATLAFIAAWLSYNATGPVKKFIQTASLQLADVKQLSDRLDQGIACEDSLGRHISALLIDWL